MRYFYGVFAAALFVGGCAQPADSEKPAAGPAQAGTKDSHTSGGYKADCINCEAKGPSAFVQLGLGDRFWEVGDAWQVVYLLKSDTRTQMQEMALQQDTKVEVGLVALDFRVTALSTRSVAGVERATATIQITQGEGAGQIGALLAGEQVQVNERTRRVDLVIDDLLRPVSVTEFSGPRGKYPNGKTIQLDWRENLRNLESAFPYIVPNAYLGAERGPLPTLPEALQPFAEAARRDDPAREYFHFDLAGKGLDSREQVYWSAGDLWPFLVETPNAVGVLVRQNN